jgi:hypothetical protein
MNLYLISTILAYIPKELIKTIHIVGVMSWEEWCVDGALAFRDLSKTLGFMEKIHAGNEGDRRSPV